MPDVPELKNPKLQGPKAIKLQKHVGFEQNEAERIISVEVPIAAPARYSTEDPVEKMFREMQAGVHEQKAGGAPPLVAGVFYESSVVDDVIKVESPKVSTSRSKHASGISHKVVQQVQPKPEKVTLPGTPSL